MRRELDLAGSVGSRKGQSTLLAKVARRFKGAEIVGATMERGSELGRGVYSLADLRVYLAFSSEWEEPKKDAGRALDWLQDVLLPVGHHRRRPDYSFGDLISLFVVRELRRKGVHGPDIRAAERYLRKKWNTDRPFTSGEIQTDGRGIYVDDDLIAGQIESAEREGQQVMRELLRERLTSVHYDTVSERAAYWVPQEHVLVDPRVQFGAPVVSGSRIPTAAVVDMTYYASPVEIERQLSISAEKVDAALSFERRLTALRN